MALKIAIIDDNYAFIDEIKDLLSKYLPQGKYSSYGYDSVDKLCLAFDNSPENCEYDLIFLDIVLARENGITAAKRISERLPYADIIFISAYTDFFREVYKVKHSYFLTKPIDETFFADAVKKSLQSYAKSKLLISGNENRVINVKSIIYIESCKRSCKIVSADKSEYECNIKLDDLCQNISLSFFIRTHKSYLVNPDYIRHCERSLITLENGEDIPISRRYMKYTREKFSDYLGSIL